MLIILHIIVHPLSVCSDCLFLKPSFNQVQRKRARHPNDSGYAPVQDLWQQPLKFKIKNQKIILKHSEYLRKPSLIFRHCRSFFLLIK